LGLRGLEIEENARRIMEQLARLKTEFTRFKDDFGMLGKHLTNSRGKYEEAERRLERFEDKLLSAGDRQPELAVTTPPIETQLPLG
jgi:DNA anti-recombination protein RmuC